MRKNSIYTILFNIIITVALLFLVSYFLIFQNALNLNSTTIVFFQGVGKWITLTISFILVRQIEKNDYLTLEEKKYNLFFYFKNIILFFIILMIANILAGKTSLFFFFFHESEKLSILTTTFKTNKYLLLFTAITAGIVEEIIFRGYILIRLLVLTKSKFLSVFSSTFLFLLMHLSYGNFISVITSTIFGILSSIYYLKFSNIKLLIFAHIIWDMIAFMIALHIKN